MDIVTVIVLNWNQYDITYACLESIFLSEKVKLQVILVDNGSHDDSSERLSKTFKGIDLVKIQTNNGYPQGVNTGLKHALTNYTNQHIVFVSNDTILDPLCFFNLVSSAKNNNGAGLVVPKIFYYDQPNVLWYAGGDLNKFFVKGTHRGVNLPDSAAFNTEKEITFGNGCVFLVTRHAIEKTGYFDTSFISYAEDVDFSIRMRLNGFKIIYSPTSMVWHRISFSTKELKSISKIVFFSIRNTIWLQSKYPDYLSGVGLAINTTANVIKYIIRSIVKTDWLTIKILPKAILNGYRDRPGRIF